MVNHIDLNILANEIFAVGYEQDKESTYLATNNWVYMMKHSFSMIKCLFMNYLPIFSRWLWKYVVYIINISLLAQIIGSHFWWYLCSIFSFQPMKYSLSATDRIRNPPTLLRIIRKSLFFFQQCSQVPEWKKKYVRFPNPVIFNRLPKSNITREVT